MVLAVGLAIASALVATTPVHAESYPTGSPRTGEKKTALPNV
jgi:hypothetical protein